MRGQATHKNAALVCCYTSYSKTGIRTRAYVFNKRTPVLKGICDV